MRRPKGEFPLPTIQPEAFKSGMRRLAASVCLITTLNEDGSRNGLTATAVCSTTAAPPTLLCCLNRSSNSFAAIERAKVFAVNVLSTDDQAVADRFSSALSGEEKFALGDWTDLETGAPVLSSAIAYFDCRLVNVVTVGTHGILLGEVHALALNPHAAKPLLYVDGAYGAFAPHEMLTTKTL
jgi:flavin reductase (DIM6/NTAB) family NADH-FMN oxidoreductase RutF